MSEAKRKRRTYFGGERDVEDFVKEKCGHHWYLCEMDRDRHVGRPPREISKKGNEHYRAILLYPPHLSLVLFCLFLRFV